MEDQSRPRSPRSINLRWKALLVLGAVAVIGVGAFAVVRAGSRGNDVPTGYTSIGSVRMMGAAEDVRFCARRSIQDGESRVSILTTPGICNGSGPYGANHILICDDGATGVGWAFVAAISSTTARAEVTTEDGMRVPLRIVPAPAGWPLRFAIGAIGGNELFGIGVKLTLYDSIGHVIPIPYRS